MLDDRADSYIYMYIHIYIYNIIIYITIHRGKQNIVDKTICEISKFMAKLLCFALDLVFLFVLCSLSVGLSTRPFSQAWPLGRHGLQWGWRSMLPGLLLFRNEFGSHEPDENCPAFRNGVLILNYCRLSI